jgi:hypothetical protein
MVPLNCLIERMFPVKHHMNQVKHFVMHSVWCRTCNPISARRQRKAITAAHDNAHIVWSDKLAADTRFANIRQMVMADARFQAALERRRERLRVALEESGADPWEAALLVEAVDRFRAGNDVIAITGRQS